MAVFWLWVWEPMLFVTIGASINFHTLQASIIPRAVLIVCTGVCVRVVVTFLVMTGFGYTVRERLFYALAWTPKATVQAALSGAAGRGQGRGMGLAGTGRGVSLIVGVVGGCEEVHGWRCESMHR